MAIVSAYSKRTGRKVRIRQEVLDSPVLGQHYALTPRARAVRKKASKKPALTTIAPDAGAGTEGSTDVASV